MRCCGIVSVSAGKCLIVNEAAHSRLAVDLTYTGDNCQCELYSCQEQLFIFISLYCCSVLLHFHPWEIYQFSTQFFQVWDKELATSCIICTLNVEALLCDRILAGATYCWWRLPSPAVIVFFVSVDS